MSAENIELVSGAQTATGQSAKRQVKTATMGVVSTHVTAISGGAPLFNHWLQHSPDGGTTWFDVPYDQQLTTNAAAGDLTANVNKRNINGTANRTTTGDDEATYKHLPAGHYRLAWTFTGGTSITFTSTLSVK